MRQHPGKKVIKMIPTQVPNTGGGWGTKQPARTHGKNDDTMA